MPYFAISVKSWITVPLLMKLFSSIGASAPGVPAALICCIQVNFGSSLANISMCTTRKYIKAFLLQEPNKWDKQVMGLHFPSLFIFQIKLNSTDKTWEDTSSWRGARPRGSCFFNAGFYMKYMILKWECVLLNLCWLRKGLLYVTFPENVINMAEASSIPRGWRAYF